MNEQRKLLRINIGIIISYILVKFFFRPFVLDHEFPKFCKIFVLSYPNFCEAVAGTLMLACIFLVINNRVLDQKRKIKERLIYGVAVVLSGIYVILQETKIHNLGGDNVYDPYDVLFSVFGLITAYLILLRIKPTFINQ